LGLDPKPGGASSGFARDAGDGVPHDKGCELVE
jgi:hypothetical protein